MIEAAPGFAPLAARMLARAQALGQARATALALTRRNDPSRWRRAALLWPLFGRR